MNAARRLRHPWKNPKLRFDLSRFPRSHWKPEWTGYALLVIVLRLIYAAFGALIVARGGPVALQAPICAVLRPYLKSDAFSHWFVNPWFQWDTVSYFKIAVLGYSLDASIAFMPLYPLLVRFAAPFLGGNVLLAALLLSTLFCFVTLVLLSELFTQVYGERLAGRALMLFIAFPTAFFLLAGYTESLFLMLVLATWLLARGRRWWLAALVAGLATLARLQGVILAPVLLWMLLVSRVQAPAPDVFGQLRQVWALLLTFRKKGSVPGSMFAWLAPLVPVAVSGGYQAWLFRSGLGTIPAALETYWRLQTVSPWEGLVLFFQRLFTIHFIYMDWVDLALFGLILVTGLIGLHRLDPASSLYVWLTLAVLLTRGTPPHLLASYSRYFLALFPLFSLPAQVQNKYIYATFITVSFGLQATLAWVFLWGSWVA